MSTTFATWVRGNEPQQEVSLERINLQDIVDPTVINDNSDVIKKYLLTNFISDYGSMYVDGASWYYYRLNNGMTLFFARYTFPHVDMDVMWEGYPSSSSLTIPGYVPVMLADVEYFNMRILSFDNKFINDVGQQEDPWSYHLLDTYKTGFTWSNGKCYPPKFCVYWNHTYNIHGGGGYAYKTSVDKLTVGLIGIGPLN